MDNTNYMVIAVRYGELTVSEHETKDRALQDFDIQAEYNLAFPLYVLNANLEVVHAHDSDTLILTTQPKHHKFESISEIAKFHNVLYKNPEDRHIVIQIANGYLETLTRYSFDDAKKEFMKDFDLGEAFPLYILNNDLQVIHTLPIDKHKDIQLKQIGWKFTSIAEIGEYHNVKREPFFTT